jgi:hypothetical protein
MCSERMQTLHHPTRRAPQAVYERSELMGGLMGRGQPAGAAAHTTQRGVTSRPTVPAVLGYLHRYIDAVVGAEVGSEQAEPDQHRPASYGPVAGQRPPSSRCHPRRWRWFLAASI